MIPARVGATSSETSLSAAPVETAIRGLRLHDRERCVLSLATRIGQAGPTIPSGVPGAPARSRQLATERDEHDQPTGLSQRQWAGPGRGRRECASSRSRNARRFLGASGLDHDTLMLVWLAALVALDASTESYLMKLGVVSQTGVSVERVHQVLTALAPIVGTARVFSATSRIMDVLRTGT